MLDRKPRNFFGRRAKPESERFGILSRRWIFVHDFLEPDRLEPVVSTCDRLQNYSNGGEVDFEGVISYLGRWPRGSEDL